MRLFCVLYIMLYFNFGFVRSADSDIIGILDTSCRFELHTSLLPWDEAYQACKHRGLTLASFGDKEVLGSVKIFIEHANVVYTSEIGWLTIRKYWVGLHMESSSGGSSEFHWGDCTPSAGITTKFDSLSEYPGATACGYVSLDSLRLTACSPSVSLGFICENPTGKDSCFTTMSTTLYRMDYDAKTALTSSDCASECITSSNCGAVYVTAGNSCSKLQYNNGLPSRLLASHLAYTHYYHRRFLNHDPYSLPFKAGLTEDDLCKEPIGSPITTGAIGDVITTKEINPTTTKEATTQLIVEDITTQTTDDTTTDDVTPQTSQDTTSEDTTSQDTTSEDPTSQDPTSEDTTSQDTTSEDTTTQTKQDTTTQEVTTQTSENTTTEDVTTQTTKDTTSEDVTTQTTEDTTTEDVTTQTTEDTATEDVTTQTTKDTTTEDVTTPTTEDTTSEDVTTPTTKDTTTEDVTTPTTEDTTSEDVTTPTTKDTTTKYVTAQTTEDRTTENVTTQTTQDTSQTTEDVTTQTTQDTTTEDTTQTTEHTTTDEFTTQTITETTTKHVTTKPIGELSTPKQIPVSNLSSCGCTCVKKNITINEKMEDMISKLKVDTSVLSSTVRTKVCAEDPRPSARNVGILGIVLITVLVGLIISMDVIRFFQSADRHKVKKKPPAESDKKIVAAT